MAYELSEPEALGSCRLSLEECDADPYSSSCPFLKTKENKEGWLPEGEEKEAGAHKPSHSCWQTRRACEVTLAFVHSYLKKLVSKASLAALS